MTDEISTLSTKAPPPRKKLFAMLAAVVIIVSGITLTSVGVANANAEETARLCTVATKAGADATKSAKASLAVADAALEAVTVLELPEGAGTSTAYAARPGVEAVKAVKAVEASDGVEAVAGVDAVEARADGAGHIAEATTARAALVKIKIPTATCTDRDQAAAITSKTADTKAAAVTLDASVTALRGDFAAFQTNEATRIAAEIEAARVAAEVEAARGAAEAAESARVAANAEADRVAANARPRASNGGSSSGDGSSSGGGSYSEPEPAPAPSGGGGSSSGGDGSQPGGGGIGLGGNGGVCWTSNGMGGTMPC